MAAEQPPQAAELTSTAPSKCDYIAYNQRLRPTSRLYLTRFSDKDGTIVQKVPPTPSRLIMGNFSRRREFRDNRDFSSDKHKYAKPLREW